MLMIGKIGNPLEVLAGAAPNRNNTVAGILMPVKMLAGVTLEIKETEGNEAEGKSGGSYSFR